MNSYTLQQCYQALNPTITTPQKFRDRLLQMSNNRQQVQVNELFRTYGFN
ncbi:MAG: hypothetical protein OHK0038_21530 [Flammeovirgaceae bacterium]